MKKIPLIATLCSLAVGLPTMADTFTLKDGTKLEAKILKENPDSYVLEVQVTKSIKDERTVLKADVAKIDRVELDTKAFETIKTLVPTPDFLSEDDYIQNVAAVEKFLKTFPNSTKGKDAKAILATLKAEAAQVSAGGIKYNGAIVTADQYKANAYELDARVAERKIRALINQDQLLPALRLYSGFDADYRTTLPYGALSPLMLQAIKSYGAEIDETLSSLDSRLKKRDQGLTQMSSDDRKNTLSAIAEEDAAFTARFKSEKEAKVVWVTTSPFHKESLDDASKFAQAEVLRLSAVKTNLGVDGGKAYREAYTAVHGGGGAAAATTAITAARTTGVPDRYLAPLEADAKGLK